MAWIQTCTNAGCENEIPAGSKTNPMGECEECISKIRLLANPLRITEPMASAELTEFFGKPGDKK